MSLKILDYSAAWITGSDMRSANYDGCIRYVGLNPNENSKIINRQELYSLLAAGRKVAFVCEAGAGTMQSGDEATGRYWAAQVRNQLQSYGVSNNIGCYYADDTADNESGGNLAAVEEFLRGAAQIDGEANVYYYGDFYAVEHLHVNLPWIRYFWQTPAWSGGLVSYWSTVYQGEITEMPTSTAPGAGSATSTVQVGGVDCDVNVVLSIDQHFGEVGFISAPTPTPQPKPVLLPVEKPMWLFQAIGDPAIYAGGPGYWYHIPNPERESLLVKLAGVPRVINAAERDLYRDSFLNMK
jgi:hypothetical protein